MGERLVVRRQFKGQNAEADSRDLAGESVRVENLVPGPGGGDLQTPPGVVRLAPLGIVGQAQNAGSGTWGRLGLQVARSSLFPEVDLLQLTTQTGPQTLERTIRRLLPSRTRLQLASAGVESEYQSLSILGKKTFASEAWAGAYHVDYAEIDSHTPTTHVTGTALGPGVYATPEGARENAPSTGHYREAFTGTNQVSEWRSLVRFDTFRGIAEGTGETLPGNGATPLINPTVVVAKATLRGTLGSDPFALAFSLLRAMTPMGANLNPAYPQPRLSWDACTVVANHKAYHLNAGSVTSSFYSMKPPGTPYASTPRVHFRYKDGPSHFKADDVKIVINLSEGWYHTRFVDVEHVLAREIVLGYSGWGGKSGYILVFHDGNNFSTQVVKDGLGIGGSEGDPAGTAAQLNATVFRVAFECPEPADMSTNYELPAGEDKDSVTEQQIPGWNLTDDGYYPCQQNPDPPGDTLYLSFPTDSDPVIASSQGLGANYTTPLTRIVSFEGPGSGSVFTVESNRYLEDGKTYDIYNGTVPRASASASDLLPITVFFKAGETQFTAYVNANATGIAPGDSIYCAGALYQEDPLIVVARADIVDRVFTNVRMWPVPENDPHQLVGGVALVPDVSPSGGIDVALHRLVSRAADYVGNTVTWIIRKTGTNWALAGASNPVADPMVAVEVALDATDTLHLTPGLSDNSVIEFDVAADVGDYLANAETGEVLQWRLLATREATGAAWAHVQVKDWTLEVEYTYEEIVIPNTTSTGAETRLEAGLRAEGPWAKEHGPMGMPWIAAGSNLVLYGHSGMRPQALVGVTLRRAGLKGVPVAPTLARVAGTALRAGTYRYRITRFDSTRARNGDSVTESEIVLFDVESNVLLTDGFVADAREEYNAYRIWRQNVNLSAEFRLVGEVTSASAEAGGYAGYEDGRVDALDVALTLVRFALPAYAGCAYWQGRFCGLGIQPWKLAGTSVLVLDGSDEVAPVGTGVVFEDWLDQRNIELQLTNGNWKQYSIAYTFMDAGVRKIRLSVPYEDSGATTATTTHWGVTGAMNRFFVGPTSWGDAETVRLDGMTWLDVGEGSGQEIVGGMAIGSRMFLYLNGSIWVVTGGKWQDTEGTDIPLNDLDSYRFNGSVGLAGPLALCSDVRGGHWFFDGKDLRYNDGSTVTDATKGRLGELLRRCDMGLVGESVVTYISETNQVLLLGLYEDGEMTARLGALYDVATDSISMLSGLGATAACEVSSGRPRALLGLSGGCVGVLDHRLGLVGDAVAAGLVDGGYSDICRLWDSEARFVSEYDRDRGKGWVLVVDGDAWQSVAVDNAQGQLVWVDHWPVWTPRRGNEYFIVNRVADGTLTGVYVPPAIQHEAQCILHDEILSVGGYGVSNWRLLNIGNTWVGLPFSVMSSAHDVETFRMTTSGQAGAYVDTARRAFVPAAGDPYVAGGWAWRWREEIVPQQGQRVAISRIVLDLTVEGRVSDRALVAVRVWSSGAKRQDPVVVWSGMIADGTNLGKLSQREILLPIRWGRVVALELCGIAMDQRVRLRGVEIAVIEE